MKSKLKKNTIITIWVAILTFALSGLYAYASELSGNKSDGEIYNLKWELEGNAQKPVIHLTWYANASNIDHMGTDFDNMLVEWEYNYETPQDEKIKDQRKSKQWYVVSYDEKSGVAKFEFYRNHFVGSGPCRYKVYFPGYPGGAEETEWIYFKSENMENYFNNKSDGKQADGKGDAVKAYRETADWPERMVSSIIVALPKYLIKVIGLYDPIELAYGININSSVLHTADGKDMEYQDDSEYFGLFSESEMRNAIGPLYDSFNDFVPMQMVMILSIIGLVYMFRSAYPDTKLTAREYASGFMFAVLMLKFGPFFLNFFTDINLMLVKLGLSIVLEYHPNAFNSGFIDAIYDPETGLIGDAVIAFIAAFSVGVINWQYAIRKLTIAVLIVMLPVSLVISIFPTRREAISIWIKEMTANMFLQAAHALVIAFMILFLRANETSTSTGLISQTFIMKLAVVMGLTTITSLVRRLIGAESMGHGAMGMLGTGLGFAGIAAVGRIMGMAQGPRRLTSAESDEANDSGRGHTTYGGTYYKHNVHPLTPQGLGSDLAGFVGKTAGKIAGGTVRAGITGTGALAGGMIGGALTGNDGIGAAGGALLAHNYGGQQAGNFVGEQVGGVVQAAGNAGLYGMKVAASELAGEDGIDKANEALGMTSEGIKYNPELAKEAGIRILGNNLPGKVLGAGLGAAARYNLSNNPGLATGVKNLNTSVVDNQARLEDIQQTELPQAHTNLDEAKVRYSEAKNLYSPKCEAMKNLNPEGTQYQDNLEKYNTAKASMEAHEASYARLQIEQTELSRAVEQQTIQDEMKKLADKNQNWTGGRLGTEWK